MTSPKEARPTPPIDTGGGAYIAGNVDAQRDVFIGTKWEIKPDVARDVTGLRNPYLGLRAFTFDDRDAFTGRADKINEAVRMLTDPAGPRTLLFVTGASGCGKSSFAQAGVQPALVAHYAQRTFAVAHVSFRPSTHPIAMLADALVQLGVPKRVAADPLGTIGTPESFAAFVGEHTAQDGVNVVLIDQFEELFTETVNPDERKAFIGILSQLPPFGSLRTHLLATLRSDFLGDLFKHRDLYKLATPGIDLREMNETELQESIERPLQARAEHSTVYHGKSWEPDLVRELAAQATKDATYLPLLQISLEELWRSGRLTLSSYRDMGWTLASAIKNRATTVVEFTDHDVSRPESRRPETDQQLILRLLLGLVQVSATADARPDSRRRRPRNKLVGETSSGAERLLKDLIDARLLSVQHQDNEAYVDIIHESLIANWDWLKAAIAAERRDLQRRARFEPAHEEWLQHGQTDDFLLRGVRLAEASELAEHDDIAMRSTTARDLLARSKDRERAEDQRELLEEQQRRDHQRALQLSESLRLASEAREIVASEPDVALLVAWEALLRDRNQLSETVFRETLDSLPASVQVLGRPGDSSEVKAAFLDSGLICATGGDGTIWSWTSDGVPRPKFMIPGGGATMILPVAGDKLLSYRDRYLRLHNAVTGQTLGTLTLRGVPIGLPGFASETISVSDDGTCLVKVEKRGWLVSVTATVKARRRLRNVRCLTLVRSLRFVDELFESPSSPPHVLCAIIDRSGSTIVIGDSDGAKVFDRDGTLRAELDAGGDVVSAAVLSDGTIVTGTMQGRGETWGADGSSRGVFRERGGLDLLIQAVDPAGKHIATTNYGSGTIEIRDATGKTLVTLAGHQGHVRSAAFSPDGKLLASGSEDGTVRVWDWSAARQHAVLSGHRSMVNYAAFHPSDASVLLSADSAGFLRLWRLESSIVPPFTGHRKRVDLLRRNAMGTLSSDGQSTRIWSMDGTSVAMEGRMLATSAAPAGPGCLVLTAAGRVARLWHIEPGREPSLRSEITSSAADGKVIHAAIERDMAASIGPAGRHVVLLQGLTPTLWSDASGLIGVLACVDSRQVEHPHDRVVGFGFDGTGSRVALASENGMVWIWSTTAGELASTFLADRSAPDRTFDLAFDPRGEMIATGVRDEVGLWNWHGERIGRLPTGGYKVYRVAFFPDGERILTIADSPEGGPLGVPELWTRTGERIARLDSLDTICNAKPVFDERGRYLCLPVGYPAHGIGVVDASGAVIGTLRAARRVCVQGEPAVAPDGERVAIAFDDGQVRIWDFATQRRIMTLRVGKVGPIDFSPDGRILLAASTSGPIERHPMHVEDLFRSAARRLGRVLTPEELRIFQIEKPKLTAASLRAYILEPAP